MNNNLPDVPEDKKIPFLLGVRDNLLKPMKDEILSHQTRCSRKNERFLFLLLVLTILNTIAIGFLLYKAFLGN